MRILFLLIFVTSTAFALPAKIQLQGVRHEYQRYNNCGPVTLGMSMSYWGNTDTQYQLAPVLKPNSQDKNVSPDEMLSLASKKGYRVHYGMAGNFTLLKTLLANNIPVVIETWFVTPDHGGMGHYRILVGYDDNLGLFRAYDSYYGPKVTLKYQELDRLWQVFNRTYLVVYPQKKAKVVADILGTRMDPSALMQKSLKLAQYETQKQPNNPFAWFNLGTSLLEQGDSKAAAKAFGQSESLYTPASMDPGRPKNVASRLPWRMMWYQFGPFEAYYKDGRYNDVIRLANDVLNRVGDHEESLYWRGKARLALNQKVLAIKDFKAALYYKPTYVVAKEALTLASK